MATATAKILLSPAEYLIMEREADFKSEYRNGNVVMMPGASRQHNLISGNIFGQLYVQLLDRTCEVYINDMRVKVSESGLYTYPDVVVVCDEPRFEDGYFDTLLNPTVIAEVLSPSTENYDRNEKFMSYQTLESLQEYILISQDAVHVEQYIRQDSEWILREYLSLDDMFQTASIECQLALRAIYAKVRFA
ncbi:Uma2 family endonuclease [Candidatus Poribacteria bacterium]|nr:Uma2 family endonuclease [Candidatus Poribacteria bacterium]